jgi:hypothetical protein
MFRPPGHRNCGGLDQFAVDSAKGAVGHPALQKFALVRLGTFAPRFFKTPYRRKNLHNAPLYILFVRACLKENTYTLQKFTRYREFAKNEF